MKTEHILKPLAPMTPFLQEFPCDRLFGRARSPLHLSKGAFRLFAIAAIVGTSLAQYPGVQGTAERQIYQTEQKAGYAQQLAAKGWVAFKGKDFESAFSYFKSSIDMLPSSGSATAATRAEALEGFSQTAVSLARQRISEGRFGDAKVVLAAVLDPRYNPNYKPAIALNDQLKNPSSFYGQTMTPGFVSNIEEVKQLLLEAEGFYQTGRYDLAFKRYEQVLNIDKYNIAARRGMEQVNLARSKYADTAYSEARGDMMRQVAKAWELPVTKYDNKGAATIIEQPALDVRGSVAVDRKLDSIIIKKINFDQATVPEAIDFLRQRAVSLDTSESDPTKKGVNIVLKLPAGTSPAPVTLELTEIPLRNALEYVANAAGLKIKVDPYAVVMMPKTEQSSALITAKYDVSSDFFIGADAPAAEPGTTESQVNAMEFLTSKGGVEFPDGSSAYYHRASGKLIVRNTRENLDAIETMLGDFQTTGGDSQKSQVNIEAKFLEVTQNNLKELGFDWLLGQMSLPFGSGVYTGGGTMVGGSQIQGTDTVRGAEAFPVTANGVPVGASSNNRGILTGANRSGSTAISANAVDALLFGSGAGAAPGVLALAGVFTNPQFQIVLRALNQSKGIDMVSAPTVLAKNGEAATIKLVREFIYPAAYSSPEVTNATSGAYQPATPTTPTSFTMQECGVVMIVTPTVKPDKSSVELLFDEIVVRQFDGFINYGSPINTQLYVLGNALAGTKQITITENQINKPVFTERTVKTKVVVGDGSTVVLGGLMSENVQKVQDKVPILGDIPLAGRLFRTVADQHVKTNLIIFVTPCVVDFGGVPYAKSQNESGLYVPDKAAVANETIPGDALSIPIPQ